MKGSKYNEDQIISILKEMGSGIGMEDICRKYSIGRSTYNRWVKRYNELGVSEMERISLLEKQLSKLKEMYAELAIENDALKELIKKKLPKSVKEEAD